MDYDTKLIHARLDAIEAILLNRIGGDQQALEQIRTMLSHEHDLAHSKQHTQNEGGMQTTVLREMRPARDTGGEAARTDAYERLCRKFGAPILK